MATAADNMSNIADQVDDVVQRKSSQLGKFLDDVEDLIRHISPIDNADITRARQKVESSINSVRNVAGRSVHQAIDSTKAAAKKTDTFVHESPWTAIGIAAVAGLVIASVMRSK
jgi:ElaB/YqjD/DUF883 family membrane-anchored ribosome-binding protein